jgi:hypothetical protein
MAQIVQVAGSLLILAAFVASQRGSMSVTSLPYLALNTVGSVILAVLAWVEHQWGFLLLETVWGLVSAAGLLRVTRTFTRQSG